ncbi:amidohydrolase family protein [Mycolicibacterium sp. 3033]|nr:amidohydrolase family protein [Mycolicibacterium aurantiacum]
MLIRRAAILDGRVVDIRVEERISAVADHIRPTAGEVVLDAAGGLVIPGLHDHHVHLHAAAAAQASVRLGPPEVADSAEMAAALTLAEPGDDGWVRAVGYHESVAGALDKTALDRLVPHVPLRVQHRSGGMWMLNSVALHRVGMAAHPDGRLRRSERDWAASLRRTHPNLRALSTRLARYGVTGVTDATPGHTAADLDAFAAAKRSGDLVQRLYCMAPEDLEAPPGVTTGPVKIILEDDDLDLMRLQRWVERCHRNHRAVAIHAVTVAQLVVAMAALRHAGPHPRDRIEHAAMVPDDCVQDLRDLGVTVVTQPNFVAERGDQYLTDLSADECRQLWRVASLIEAGVDVALSTDQPFGDADPWAVARAAVYRATPTGHVIGAADSISASRALAMFFGRPEAPTQMRTIAVGQPGDLCVLSEAPAEVLHQLDADLVAATVISGELVSGWV